jgi:hypothetical protein
MTVHADLQYPSKFLNEWDDTPPLRSIFGGSPQSDLTTATKYNAKLFRHLVGFSHAPPSSQESTDTNRTTTSLRDKLNKVKHRVTHPFMSNLSSFQVVAADVIGIEE